jgi:hypothetical protein
MTALLPLKSCSRDYFLTPRTVENVVVWEGQLLAGRLYSLIVQMVLLDGLEGHSASG